MEIVVTEASFKATENVVAGVDKVEAGDAAAAAAEATIDASKRVLNEMESARSRELQPFTHSQEHSPRKPTSPKRTSKQMSASSVHRQFNITLWRLATIELATSVLCA